MSERTFYTIGPFETFVVVMDKSVNATCWLVDSLGEGWVGGYAVYTDFSKEETENSFGEYFEFQVDDHDYENNPITCVVARAGGLILPEDGKSVYLKIREKDW